MKAIEARHLEIIRAVLAKYPYTFYAFGSRVTGKARRFSDLDICFIEAIPWAVRAHIDEDFELSDLPYQVDVVDWHLCDADFQRLIKQDLMLIQKGKSGLTI